MYGGFVAWEMGQQADGSDSIAVQVPLCSHSCETISPLYPNSNAHAPPGCTRDPLAGHGSSHPRGTSAGFVLYYEFLYRLLPRELRPLCLRRSH